MSAKDSINSENSTSKNQTYQRALDAFFKGDEIPNTVKDQLPSEVDGLSVKRSQMIKQVKESPSDNLRSQALKALIKDFGIPSDLEIIYYALAPGQDYTNVLALETLQAYLQKHENVGSWQDLLKERLQSLQIRSFDTKLLHMIESCLEHI